MTVATLTRFDTPVYFEYSAAIEEEIHSLSRVIQEVPALSAYSARWLAIQLLEDDVAIRQEGATTPVEAGRRQGADETAVGSVVLGQSVVSHDQDVADLNLGGGERRDREREERGEDELEHGDLGSIVTQRRGSGGVIS